LSLARGGRARCVSGRPRPSAPSSAGSSPRSPASVCCRCPTVKTNWLKRLEDQRRFRPRSDAGRGVCGSWSRRDRLQREPQTGGDVRSGAV